MAAPYKLLQFLHNVYAFGLMLRSDPVSTGYCPPHMVKNHYYTLFAPWTQQKGTSLHPLKIFIQLQSYLVLLTKKSAANRSDLNSSHVTSCDKYFQPHLATTEHQLKDIDSVSHQTFTY